jgi:hypothetical protein
MFLFKDHKMCFSFLTGPWLATLHVWAIINVYHSNCFLTNGFTFCAPGCKLKSVLVNSFLVDWV